MEKDDKNTEINISFYSDGTINKEFGGIIDSGTTKLFITEFKNKRIPLEFCFKPKEDITTFELAKCLPYILGHYHQIYEVDETEPHFRNFKIIDRNK